MNSLGGKILGLIVSIGLIAGGLSGEMVLRGTESSGALVAVGFCFLIWDIFSIAKHNTGLQGAAVKKIIKTSPVLPAPRAVNVKRTFNNSRMGNFTVVLNGKPIGEITHGTVFSFTTDKENNAISAFETKKKKERTPVCFFKVISNAADGGPEIEFNFADEIGAEFSVLKNAGLERFLPEETYINSDV